MVSRWLLFYTTPPGNYIVFWKSYKNLCEAGLEWISGLSGTVKVPSILNPAGLDRVRWRELSIPEEFAAKQEAVIRAYESLGILPWCTCTP
ncbi:MAG: aconitase X [Euryarchaeota archaeon]|nr:aconitase X [Euryarchaeota archaeon]